MAAETDLSSPSAIIAAIEQPGGSVALWRLETARLEDLIGALAVADRIGTRKTLYVVLGNRGDPEAASTLIDALDDVEWDVRSAAADALGKVGLRLRRENRAVPDEIGAALLRRWQPGESSWFLSALGATRYEPAQRLLIESIEHGSVDTRSAAAWGLGELGGEAARAALERAIAGELDPHVRGQVESSLERLS